ncbi:MAG: non-hydrolyzing UDP-N-acetylglucosamine 2-epimerase, partial [Bdellovibrionota bacterium]
EMYAPCPEELNRRLLSALAALHFAPTQAARQNLLREGVPGNRITVTGNTGIDALKIVVERLRERPPAVPVPIPSGQKMILVTLHRRESFGEGIENVCEAMRELAKREDVEIVLPVHLNPNVRGTVQRVLSGVPRVHLVEPLDYLVFASLLSRCHLVITDSGGIQEEATSVGKPILVTRESTERPEALESGCAGLVGTDPAKILREATLLLDDPTAYKKAARPSAAFGTGEASRMIAKRILENRSEGA